MKRALIVGACLLLFAGLAVANPMSRTAPQNVKGGVSMHPSRDYAEGFEGAGFPPTGWSEVATCVTDSCTNWEPMTACVDYTTPYEGLESAYITWSSPGTCAGGQDEWLKFSYDLSEREVNTLTFASMGSTYWTGNANLIVTIDGTPVWDFHNSAGGDWVWEEFAIDLSGYRGVIEIGFGYVGDDGAEHYLDAVSLSYETPPDPPCCPLDVVYYDFDFNLSSHGVQMLLCDGGVGTWEWGVPDPLVPITACDGVPVTNVLGTTLIGPYPTGAGSIAMLGPVDITEDCWCMELCHFYDFESEYAVWDAANVKVSPDGGTNWFLVYPADGYDGIAPLCTDAYHPLCVCEEEVFGYTNTEFVRDCFDLRAFIGESITIGLCFGSDTYATPNIGWYIKWARIGHAHDTSVEQSSWGNIKAMYR